MEIADSRLVVKRTFWELNTSEVDADCGESFRRRAFSDHGVSYIAGSDEEDVSCDRAFIKVGSDEETESGTGEMWSDLWSDTISKVSDLGDADDLEEVVELSEDEADVEHMKCNSSLAVPQSHDAVNTWTTAATHQPYYFAPVVVNNAPLWNCAAVKDAPIVDVASKCSKRIPSKQSKGAEEACVAVGLKSSHTTSPGVQSEEAVEQTKQAERTTIMVKKLKEDCTRADLIEMLDAQGLRGLYDFVYIPVDFQTWTSYGYAFINMVTNQIAERTMQQLSGLEDWKLPQTGPLEVRWSDPHQGLDVHIERHRNSPVMHKDVPEMWKPMIFHEGVPIPFPAPTKRILRLHRPSRRMARRAPGSLTSKPVEEDAE